MWNVSRGQTPRAAWLARSLAERDHHIVGLRRCLAAPDLDVDGLTAVRVVEVDVGVLVERGRDPEGVDRAVRLDHTSVLQAHAVPTAAQR